MKGSPSPKQFLAAWIIGFLLLSWRSSQAQQPNAWEINHNSPLPGVLEYVTNLTPFQMIASRTSGWHYSVLGRVVTGGPSPATHSMAFGDGIHRFFIFFDVNGSGNLTAQLLSTSNVIYTLPVPPTDVLKYHLHEIIFNPSNGLATYRFDGNVIESSWGGNSSSGQSNQVMWGASSPSGQGMMNYHRTEFDINGQGAIATYDAGFAGSPPAAPPPASQGWTEISNGVGILEAPLSPDSEFIHPIAVTSNATTLHPGEALLSGNINPNGWPASYWFEHGPTTSYGNMTPLVSAGAGTSFIAVTGPVVTGLPEGTTYHFRVVASNSVGTVPGADMSFTVSQSPPITSTPAGGGQPFDLHQPSLELNYIVATNGVYPSQDGGSFVPPVIGEVRLFAGAFEPAGWTFCQGQPLSISNILFDVIGTTYGGDGQTNFNLPDFRSRTIVAAGQGLGLSQYVTGERSGFSQLTLPLSSLPAHAHSLPPPDNLTGSAGSSEPRLNGQPSLAVSSLFLLEGFYPINTQTIYEPFLAQMPFFAGNFAVGGTALASGQLLPINQNQALYSVISNYYGGDGRVNFALPDVRSRTPMGSGQGNGLSARPLTQQTGSEAVTMTVGQMPAHQHAVPWISPFGFLTGPNGSNQPQSLIKPSLALQFIISTNGEVPSVSNEATNKMIGEIQLYAGTNVPMGWAQCNGQLLPVSAYPDLFGVISNYYGGDGVTTFALPDLQGRIPVGSSNGIPGAVYGAEQVTLTVAQMPAHTHTVPALDYDRWITLYGQSGATAAFDADADGDGLKNGFEWAIGANPTNAGSPSALQILSASNAVNIQFRRNSNATDVNFFLERSTNLGDPNGWAAFATNIAGVWNPSGIVTESGGTNPVNVNVSDARTNQAADYRLRINWP